MQYQRERKEIFHSMLSGLRNKIRKKVNDIVKK